MRIEKVYLRGFPPFGDAQLTFPPTDVPGKGELHLLVGQNGTGKTRLLCLLAAAFGNRSELNARVGNENSLNSVVVCRFGAVCGVWGTVKNHAWWTPPEKCDLIADRMLKGQGGDGGASSTLSASDNRPPEAETGTVLAFRGTGRVSDAQIAAMNPVKVGEPPSWLSFDHVPDTDLVIGQSMANIKMGAAMESMSAPNGQPGRATKIARRLEEAISEITGRSFYFVVEPTPKVALKVYWGGVPMMLKQLPDGLRSIIGWLVSCVAKMSAIHPEHEDPLNLPLILLLDEPESHLHPAWQRKVLPAVQTLFPQAQIVVATHSPFVIASANEGWIHVLRADEKTGIVTIDKPRPCLRGDTYLDVVEDVLGMTPLEAYDPETEQLLRQFRTTLDAALGGTETEESHLNDLAKMIADRGKSLEDLVGREMHQFGRLMAQKRASA